MLDPVVEQNVISHVMTIDVPDPELKLKTGMTANVNAARHVDTQTRRPVYPP